MAVDMVGRTSTDDVSPVCSEAEVEAYTTLESTTGECLVLMMEEGEIRHMEDDLWLLDTGAIGQFSRMILDHSRTMLNAAGCYVVREVTLSRSWGPVFFVFPFDLRRGWSA